MTIAARTIGEVTVLDLEGTLAGEEAGSKLREQIVTLLQEGRTRLLLNLAQVPYMDSRGLGDLIASKKAVLVAGAQLKLVRLQKNVYGVLAGANLTKVFDCFDDEGEALESFRS